MPTIILRPTSTYWGVRRERDFRDYIPFFPANHSQKGRLHGEASGVQTSLAYWGGSWGIREQNPYIALYNIFPYLLLAPTKLDSTRWCEGTSYAAKPILPRH